MQWINEDDARRQMEAHGLLLPGGPLELSRGGTSRRCKVEGMGAEKRGWYRLSEWTAQDGVFLVGTFGWFEGDNANTHKIELSKPCAACGFEAPLKAKECPSCHARLFKPREMTKEERDALAARRREDAKLAAAERERETSRAAEWAGAVWRAARPAALADHDYLARKGLTETGGARLLESVDGIVLEGAEPGDLEYLATFVGALVLPFHDAAGRVYGLQFILARPAHRERIAKTGRDKEFWPSGMEAAAHYLMIGGTPRDVCLVTEGFATGITLRMATGLSVAVAYNAGNVPKVVAALAAAYKRVKFLACADDDWIQKCRECGQVTPVETETCAHCGKPHGKINAGVTRAREAAVATSRCAVAVPQFAAPRPADKKGPTDYNDLAALEGTAVVAAQIDAAIAAQGWAFRASAPALAAGETQQGGGGDDFKRPPAVSSLDLDQIAGRFVYVDDDTGEFAFDHWTRNVVRMAKVKALLPAGARYDELKMHPTWRGRAVYIDQIGFDPGGEDANILCNRWQGWPMTAKAGNCDHLISLLRHLCALEDRPDEVFGWICKWLAYPLQHPGAKMATALVVHGPQGVGKNMVFEAVAKIYGDYGIVINQAALEDKFNSDWTERKCFVLADEVVSRAELHHLKNQLKGLVTGEWVRINPKNVAAHRERNHMNIVFASNEAQPVQLERDDRRYCVVWTPGKLSPDFYSAVAAEIAGDGLRAFYHYLLTLDLGDFKPWTLPPKTRAKTDLIKIGAPSVESFVADWYSGDADLPFCPCSSAALYRAYTAWCKDNGEKFPRTSAQFIGSLAKLEDWTYGHKDVLVSLAGSGTRRARVIVPPEVLVAKADQLQPGRDHRRHEGMSLTRWISEGWFAFENATQRFAQ